MTQIRAEDAGIVTGLFSRPEDARLAVDALESAGFDRSRIHLWTRAGRRGYKLVEASRTFKVVKGAAAGAGIGVLLALFLIVLPVYSGNETPVLGLIAGSAHIILAVAVAGTVAGALRGLAIGKPRADADTALRNAGAARHHRRGGEGRPRDPDPDRARGGRRRRSDLSPTGDGENECRNAQSLTPKVVS